MNLKNQTKEPKKSGKITRRHIVNSICVVFLSATLLVSLVSYVILDDILNNQSKLDTDHLIMGSSSRIFDADGNLITTLRGTDGIRENIKYSELPQVVVDAFLSIEDSRFFTHNGFDLPRFIKSGYANVLGGGFKQGGSTLTMQLVDVGNSLMKASKDDEEQTATKISQIEDKIKEIFKAMDIETKLNKEEVFEKYINLINFGGPVRGIQKAAQYYFGKEVHDVNLSEAAFLAGVINKPFTFNPYNEISQNKYTGEYTNHYQEAVGRRNTTLYQMWNHGYITKAEYELAINTELANLLTGAKDFTLNQYAGFIELVTKEAREKTGEDPYLVQMDIYTTMNREAQDFAENISKGTAVDYRGNVIDIPSQYNDRYESAISVINNQTGEILALGDGRSKGLLRSWNEDQQIGSTSKPLISYGPAFDNLGYSTQHVFGDWPTEYGTSVMYNADSNFEGDITFNRAITRSRNVPSYTTLKALVNTIGAERIQTYLKNMGMSERTVNGFVQDFGPFLGYAIGGGDFRTTPLELAGAYSMFANKGDFIKPYTVKKIVFNDKKKEDYVAAQERQNVISEGAAWLTSYLLKDVVDSAWGNISALKTNYRIYGKTGTSDYDIDSTPYYPDRVPRDKWIVGYTNQYTVSAWAGYDKPDPNERNWLNEWELLNWNLEGRIARTMMDIITKDGTVGVGELPQPADVVAINQVLGAWPYATAPEGLNVKTVTGYILKKFSTNLRVLQPLEINAPADTAFNATLDGTTLNFNLALYPDESRRTAANTQKTVTVNGVTATGPVLFDPSFVFGILQNKVDISVNGTLVTTINNQEQGSFNTWASELKNGDEIKACGYYGYTIANKNGSQVCKTFTVTGAETDFVIRAEFDKLFSDTLTFEEVSAKVDTFMKTYYPKIEYKIYPSTEVPAGTLDPRSNIRSGEKVSTGLLYSIFIGK